MIRRISFFRFIRRYQLLLAGLLMVVAMFAMAHPEVPKDLNYRYQLDIRLRSYPLVAPTASLVEWSTERIREVYRWNLTAETVGQAMPGPYAGTPGAVTWATAFIFLGAAAMILIWFAPSMRMVGMGLVIFVIAGSHLFAHPADYSRLAAAPSILIPNITATLVTHADPGHSEGIEREAAFGLKDMADRYFEQYVRFTEHRMADPGKNFATAKRGWFGLSGLAYVLPFAVILASLAALVTLLQTLAWALLVLAPFGLAVALADGRAGLKVWNHVIMPALATLIMLALLGLALPLVLFLATLIHATEFELGRILVGSLFPIALVVVGVMVARRMPRRARGGAHARHRAASPEDGPDRTRLHHPARHALRVLDPRARRHR